MNLNEAPKEVLDAAIKGVKYLASNADLISSVNDEICKTWMAISGCLTADETDGKQGYTLLFANCKNEGVNYICIFIKFSKFVNPIDNGYAMSRMNSEKALKVIAAIGEKNWGVLIIALLMIMGLDPQELDWSKLKTESSWFKN